jgi:hypothetical protein
MAYETYSTFYVTQCGCSLVSSPMTVAREKKKRKKKEIEV